MSVSRDVVVHGDLHQEERVGGWTTKEYTDDRGTEKAYDSGLCVGNSMSTASTISVSIHNY